MARRNHYQVLMVDPSADIEIITLVHRKLAQRYHPDVSAVPDAAARMLELNEAWNVLKDPERRRRYDAELAAERAIGIGSHDRPAPAQRASPARPTAPRPSAASSRGAPRPLHATPGRTPPATPPRPPADPPSPWGEAGPPPPGPRTGSLLGYGRYRGWTLDQVARWDPDFLEWLRRHPSGRQYRAEIDRLLGPLVP